MNIVWSIFFIAAFTAIVYYLGMVQGRWFERSKRYERERRSEWIAREALLRWSPWTKSAAEWHALLVNDYYEVTGKEAPSDVDSET